MFNPETNQTKKIEPPPIHYKARTEKPASYQVERFPVPDDKVLWTTPFPDYKPNPYTAQSVIDNDVTHPDRWKNNPKGGWADPENVEEVDFTQRKSHCGEIIFDTTNGRPLNPYGRTGITERGLLGKWGPNHAADPIIIRKNPIFGTTQLLVIQRDNGQLALPGGIIDNLEDPLTAALRELLEEAIKKDNLDVNKFFNNMIPVYSGYVDDPRNTDNAWMETCAFVKELLFAESLILTLKKQDDEKDVKNAQWIDLTEENINSLYASHAHLVRLALAKINPSK